MTFGKKPPAPSARARTSRTRPLDALAILAGCPETGATELSLTSLGVEPRQLDALVRAGRVATWVQRLHHPRIDVRWYALRRRG